MTFDMTLVFPGESDDDDDDYAPAPDDAPDDIEMSGDAWYLISKRLNELGFRHLVEQSVYHTEHRYDEPGYDSDGLEDSDDYPALLHAFQVLLEKLKEPQEQHRNDYTYYTRDVHYIRDKVSEAIKLFEYAVNHPGVHVHW